ncbi:MAG TPA: VOC family protein [Candidatus Binatia bacterium]|nr:VOC family protein [Candidatus Binatia bacterium]
MNPVVHFEMPYEDRERVATFYEKAFGWKMNKLGKEMNDYITAETAETENRMVKTPGTINGGFYPKSMAKEGCVAVVIAVKDIQAAMKNVAKAGGKVVDKPVEIPGIGKYVGVVDTEGNRVNLLQPKGM